MADTMCAPTAKAEPLKMIRHTCAGCRDRMAVPGYRLCWRCLLRSDAPTACLLVAADTTHDAQGGAVPTEMVVAL
jgi:hypothetical protein